MSHRRPWRRHLHLSVRVLIVLVLLVGGGLGWVVRSTGVQRQALAAIRRAGGNYTYDWQYVGGEFVPFARPGWPEWLVARLGEDYFGHVNWVGLHVLKVPEEGPPNDHEKRIVVEALAQIGHLSRLEELDIEGTEAGDSGLANLERLTHLKALTVCDWDLTDPGFLETMTELEHLDLNDSAVGDAGLAHLKGLTRLRILELVGTKVTDGGLAHLKGLTSLQDVYLGDTKITDAGVRELQEALPRLRISR
jgi:internalin A